MRKSVKTRKDSTSLNYILIRPFLRWAGGKQKLIRLLLPFVPPNSVYKQYYEPFFGAGSLFFAVEPRNAILSDINVELMNCYRQVAKYPKIISRLLHQYAQKDSSDFFYQVRSMPTNNMSLKERAARFIYLNKAAFNGIYRVNKDGKFNVPYGPSINGPAIPSTETLTLASQCLLKAKILAGDFEEILSNASAHDFVYFDPPYLPLSDTAYFTHYSPQRFGWDDQKRVARVFVELSKRGCLVMLSNTDQEIVTSLYSKFNIFRLTAIRWLGSNGDRFRAREIVVTNYKPLE